jgi:hypothetical protein
MSTIISVYLFVAIAALVTKAIIKGVPNLLAYIVLAPVAPFIVAWISRKERPLLSRLLAAVWLVFFLLAAFVVTIGR